MRRPAPLRYSSASGWSILTAILVAIGQFAILLAIASARHDLSIAAAFVVILSPFVTFFIGASTLHRRVLTFDEVAGTLSIRGKIFLVPVGRDVVVPLSDITSIEFIERSDGEGRSCVVRIGVNGAKHYEITAWRWGGDKWRACREIASLLTRSGRTNLPTDYQPTKPLAG
jgi:hypothetical protein